MWCCDVIKLRRAPASVVIRLKKGSWFLSFLIDVNCSVNFNVFTRYENESILNIRCNNLFKVIFVSKVHPHINNRKGASHFAHDIVNKYIVHVRERREIN